MNSQLKIRLGQYTDKGRKPGNQDFHGACVPAEPLLSSKGAAIALADGISSSEVSHMASASAVSGFLEDYFCTSEAWSVRKSAQRVLMATNSWLHAQTRQSQYRYERDKGYVCTFSALVIKSATAHLFHVGDARIYRLQQGALEQLTNDHRYWVSSDTSHLARALGVNPQLEIDYHALPLEQGDTFLLATDGVYEHADPRFIAETVARHGDNLDFAARLIVEDAYAQGSPDNLTVQIVRVEELPARGAGEAQRQLAALKLSPPLEARMELDGYRILRRLHASSRSHVHLAVNVDSGARVVLKTPSIDLREDAAYLERLLLEEWIARRIDDAHVVKPCAMARPRTWLYTVMEYVEGQTLAQWMIDNPRPDLETVRDMVEQMARGLRAFHRLEMLHQDLRPDNIMVDGNGILKILDFGSTRVAGIAETGTHSHALLGTAQYTAPEYFLGEAATPRSDLFSLGVIAYQMLAGGRLPYGAAVVKARTRVAQNRLAYRSMLDDKREIPAWVDEVLRKAVHPAPDKRYGELSEFVYDLRHPNREFLSRTRAPLMERDPLLFWKGVAALLALAVVLLLVK